MSPESHKTKTDQNSIQLLTIDQKRGNASFKRAKEAVLHRNRNSKSNASQLSTFPSVNKQQKVLKKNGSPHRNSSKDIIYTQDVYESSNKNRKMVSLPAEMVNKNMMTLTTSVIKSDSQALLANIESQERNGGHVGTISAIQQAIPIYTK